MSEALPLDQKLSSHAPSGWGRFTRDAQFVGRRGHIPVCEADGYASRGDRDGNGVVHLSDAAIPVPRSFAANLVS